MRISLILSAVALCLLVLSQLVSCSSVATSATDTSVVPENSYPVHRDITATLFWIGEGETAENAYISNVPSCWDEDWVAHYGGIDTPDRRDGWLPADFTPQENPFYIALPYNDFGHDGRRANAKRVIPWAAQKSWGSFESMCKNQWVRLAKGDKVVFAQWEDSGPFVYNDVAYVFGTARPMNRQNQHAGIDLSPAVHDYLGLQDVDKVDWQFVQASAVPDGPWKDVITDSQVNWK